MGCALNADVPLPSGLPARPALPELNVPPGVDPRLGVPNPVVVPKPVVPSPVAPKVLVPSAVANAVPAVRPVLLSPDVPPKGVPRDDVPIAPREPPRPMAGFV